MGRAYMIYVYEEEKPVRKTGQKSVKAGSCWLRKTRGFDYTSLSSLTWSSAELPRQRISQAESDPI